MASELLMWARGMTIVQRTLALEQLSFLEKAAGYGPEPLAVKSTMQVSV